MIFRILICSLCEILFVFAFYTGGSQNLDLNLGIATPGHGPKENSGKFHSPSVPYTSSRVYIWPLYIEFTLGFF
jgi:hypothetical protein